MTAHGPERRGPERPGPDYPAEWDQEPEEDDVEMCECGHGWDWHEQESLMGGHCYPRDGVSVCPCTSFRPAAPSEPPAVPDLMDNLKRSVCRHLTWTIDTEKGTAHCARCGVPWAEPQPPAETQQDDKLLAEGRRLVYNVLTLPEEHQVEVGADMIARSLAARPSADTETLRRVRALAQTFEAEGNGLGGPSDRAYAAAANMLRAALDGSA